MRPQFGSRHRQWLRETHRGAVAVRHTTSALQIFRNRSHTHVSIFVRCRPVSVPEIGCLSPGTIKMVVQSSPMDYPPFLKEILTRLLTPRITLLAPPPQKELIDKLLSVSDDELTNRSGPRANCIRSLLLLQAGEFDRSHSIVQGMTGADAAYIHGMIHRVEGDYSNAGYWFRQALADPFYRGLPTDPIQITEAVAKARTPAPDADVVKILQAEFESLLRSLM